MREKKTKPSRTCGECIHEFACAMWNVGTLRNTDATHCTNYERLSDFKKLISQMGRSDGDA